MIRIDSLTKNYGQFTAVQDISFQANPGEVFGLLGPNGAGKSTTINCISGLLKPTAGEVDINGHSILSDPIKAKASLGLVPQDLALYEDLTGSENLKFWGQAYGLTGDALNQRVDQVLEQVGLTSRRKDLVSTYSGGMKRRLNFACAILHEPKVLLLDEPTVGVDPQSREHLLTAVETLKQQGTAVLYTTHYMEEAERLCDQIAIVDHGQIIASGSVDALRQEVGEKDLITLQGNFKAVDQALLEGYEVLEWQDDAIRLMVANAAHKLSELLSLFPAQTVQQTAVQRASLESLFIKLTGRALRD